MFFSQYCICIQYKYVCIKGKVCTKNSYETLFYLWSKFFV